MELVQNIYSDEKRPSKRKKEEITYPLHHQYTINPFFSLNLLYSILFLHKALTKIYYDMCYSTKYRAITFLCRYYIQYGNSVNELRVETKTRFEIWAGFIFYLYLSPFYVLTEVYCCTRTKWDRQNLNNCLRLLNIYFRWRSL